jgi:hypothetical protein
LALIEAPRGAMAANDLEGKEKKATEAEKIGHGHHFFPPSSPPSAAFASTPACEVAQRGKQ